MFHNLKSFLVFSFVPGKHSEMLAVTAPVFSCLSYNYTILNKTILLDIFNFDLEVHIQRKMKKISSEYTQLLGEFY